MALQPGANLGQYRIAEQLGRGGMATVYKAYQPSLDRYVAVKVLPSFYAEDPEYLSRFRQEAISIARMRHPNILAVYDYGEQMGVTYIVSEYVPGGTLARYLSKPVSLDFAVTLLKPVASALDYAHSRKPAIIHRDIKPSNILLTEDGLPVVSDFGIAKMMGGGVKTQTGIAVGTPEYMAPEQALGNASAASDIYSLGVVLYQLVTGQVPYTADTPVAIVLAHINNPLPMPRALRTDLPEAVESVILKALSKEPGDRFETAGAMVRALEKAATQGAMAVPPVEPPTVVRGLDAPRSADSQPLGAPPATAPEPAAEAPVWAAPPETRKPATVPGASVLPDRNLAPTRPLDAVEFAKAEPELKRLPAEQRKRDRGAPWWLAVVVVPLVLIAAAGFWILSEMARQEGQPTAASVAGALTSTSRAAAVPEPTTVLLVLSTPEGGSSTVPARLVATGTAPATRVPIASGPVTSTAISLPSVTPTAISVPSATATPLPEPTSLPAPAAPAAVEATSSPVPKPTPVPTEKPTATPSPQPSTPGLITDFESFGTWQLGDQPNGSFTQSSEKVHGGSFSGKLSYNLPDNEGDFVVFLRQPPSPMGGQPTVVRIWVYEDGSGHFLNGLLRDSQGERWQVSFGRLTNQGWTQREAIIGANQPWPSGHWDGPANGVIDYPVAFAGLVLDRVDGPLSGAIYIDDLSYGDTQ